MSVWTESVKLRVWLSHEFINEISSSAWNQTLWVYWGWSTAALWNWLDERMDPVETKL